MPQSAEAVLEMIVKGQRETEEAFEKVGDGMKQVADQSEIVNSRMSKMSQGLELAQKNMGKLAMAAASMGAAAWALNKVQKEYMESSAALQFAVERQGVAWQEVEQQLQPLMLAFSQATAISFPELERATADLTLIVGDANEAFRLVKLGADMKGAGLTFEQGFDLVKKVLGGDEGATAQLKFLYQNFNLTGEGMELLNQLAPQVVGSAEKMATPFDKLQNNIGLVASKLAELNEALGGFPVVAIGVVAGAAAIAGVIALIGSGAGLVALGISALITALLLIWENWDKIIAQLKKRWDEILADYRAVWDPFWKRLQTIWTEISEGWQRDWATVVEGWQTFWDNMGGIFQGFVGLLKGGVNAIINLLNILIRAFNRLPEINIPSWVPGLGGKSFGIPDIPEIPGLQHGTASWRGGAAIVGEAGPELVNLPRGASVTPMGGMQRIIIYLDSRVIAEAVIPHWTEEVRLQGI